MLKNMLGYVFSRERMNLRNKRSREIIIIKSNNREPENEKTTSDLHARIDKLFENHDNMQVLSDMDKENNILK